MLDGKCELLQRNGMGHLHSGSLSEGPDGYYVLKPSRQNSSLGRREPHTIHQMTMLHNVDTSIARSHLKRDWRGR